jgi:hypothetical protein
MTDDPLEFFMERAAIIEFDGGSPRHEAEFRAAVLTVRFCDTRGLDKPEHPLIWFCTLNRVYWSAETEKPESGWKPWS